MKGFKRIFLVTAIAFAACQNQPSTVKATTGKQQASPSSGKHVERSCQEVVYEILTTSKRFKELTNGLEQRVAKNGGTSYGTILEGSPDKSDSTETSMTYDYNLHETYPDHDVVIARFSFDTHKRQLYELNILSDSLVSIEFDRSLLTKLNQSCH